MKEVANWSSANSMYNVYTCKYINFSQRNSVNTSFFVNYFLFRKLPEVYEISWSLHLPIKDWKIRLKLKVLDRKEITVGEHSEPETFCEAKGDR